MSSNGCSDATQVPCVDSACPAGQFCGNDGACTPIPLPTAVGDLGRHTALALREDGRRVVATYDSTYRNLVLVSERPDLSLERRILDGYRIDVHALVDTDSGRWPSIAVDAQDRVHIAWHDVDHGELRYAAIEPVGPWSKEVVDGDGGADRGAYSSMALASDGRVHLAYRDTTGKSLRYAVREPSSGWETFAISGCTSHELDSGQCPSTQGEVYGEYANLALVGGRPRIAFYDRLRGDLKLANRLDDGQWAVTTVDGHDAATDVDTGDVGRFARVAVDAKMRLGIAYFDASRKALRFWSEALSEPLTVDNGVYTDEASGAERNHIVGQHVAIHYDQHGRAVLLYLDASRLVLKKAVVSGASVVEAGDLADGLPGGVALDFRVTSDGRLVGAYGQWLADEAPRTSLVLFDLGGMPDEP